MKTLLQKILELEPQHQMQPCLSVELLSLVKLMLSVARYPRDSKNIIRRQRLWNFVMAQLGGPWVGQQKVLCRDLDLGKNAQVTVGLSCVDIIRHRRGTTMCVIPDRMLNITSGVYYGTAQLGDINLSAIILRLAEHGYIHTTKIFYAQCHQYKKR